jgi:hypothetical protein
MNTLNIFADLRLDVILAVLTLIRKVRTVRNLIAEVVNPAGRACLTDRVFVVMERSCWKGWFVPPPCLEDSVFAVMERS